MRDKHNYLMMAVSTLVVSTVSITKCADTATTTTPAVDTTQFDCPLPNGVESATSNSCQLYTACRWTDGRRCLLTEHVGYQPFSREITSSHASVLLRRKSDVTMYGDDVEVLKLDYIKRSNSITQITIRDANRPRYEVPFDLNFPERGRKHRGRPQFYAEFPTNENKPLVRLAHGPNNVDISPILIYSEQFIELHIVFDSEDVYGFGENNHDRFRHNVSSGTTWSMFARDRPPGDGIENLYGVHPFFAAIEDRKGRSFGAFVKNSNAMEYRFQKVHGRTALTLRTIGGIIDLIFMFGPSPLNVIQQYHTLIGRPIMPAYWGLGFQLSRFGYKNTTDILRIYANNRRNDIPQDIQYADIDYMDNRRDFTVDPVLFANLSDLVKKMRAKNVHFVLIYDPAISIDFGKYPPVDRGKQADVFVKWLNDSFVPHDQCKGCLNYVVGRVWPKNLTLFPDFFNNNTLQWWSREIALFHERVGRPDGFWIDMNEPSNFGTNQRSSDGTANLQCPRTRYDDPPYPTMIARDPDSASKRLSEKTLCMTAVQMNSVFPAAENTNDNSGGNTATGSKLLHYDVHNLYGWSEFRATRAAMNSVLQGRRGILVGRSTYPGSGKWGGHWLGDNTSRWKDMRRSIVGILEMSMFGIPYTGADICGFNGNTTESLCLRWMQLGAFYPFCRNHNTDDGVAQDPAQWPAVARASRQALGMRYRLLPVLYTQLYLAQKYGAMVLRPLAFQFPKDRKLRDVDAQFMWGDKIMIAPVLYEERMTEVDVMFPEGGWYDLRNGTLARHSPSSGQITYNVAMDEMIPVFVRDGSILVMQKNETTTHASRRNPFEVHVFARHEGRGELYWDDGDSLDSPASSADHYHSFYFYRNHTLSCLATNNNTATMHRPAISVVKFYGVERRPSRTVIDGRNNGNMLYDAALQTLTLSPLQLHMAHNHDITLIFNKQTSQ